MKIIFNLYCICGKQECFLVQTQLCQFVTTPNTTVGNAANGATTDVWCEPRPISIRFSPANSSYKTWLYLLSFCHHIRGFKETFIATISAGDGISSGAPTSTKNWFINRIHFPHALLEIAQLRRFFKTRHYCLLQWLKTWQIWMVARNAWSNLWTRLSFSRNSQNASCPQQRLSSFDYPKKPKNSTTTMCRHL